MFKTILSCFFGGRRKVQVTKFAFEDFIFVVGSAAHSVHNHGFCGGGIHFPRKTTSMFMSICILSRKKIT